MLSLNVLGANRADLKRLAESLLGPRAAPYKASSGFSSSLFVLPLGKGKKLALKFFMKPEKGSPETEAEALELALVRGLPTPKPICTGNIERVPFLVRDFIAGVPLWTALLKGAEHASLYEEMGSLLARLHSIRIHKGSALDRHTDYQRFVAFRFKENLEFLGKSRALEKAEVRAARGMFDESAFKGARQNSFLHGDFFAGQVLVGKGKICGIIDFESAFAGDPMFDITYAHLMQAINTPITVPHFFKGYLESGRIRGDYDELLASYWLFHLAEDAVYFPEVRMGRRKKLCPRDFLKNFAKKGTIH